MFKSFENRTEDEILLSQINYKFNNNEIVCKEMLELINNKTTKVKLDEDIKDNYYVYLNDKIYLSDREKCRSSYLRFSVVAHECSHSVQNKTLQAINFILSNIEMLSFIAALLCIVHRFNINIAFYTYIILNIISTIPRLILETDAIIKSYRLCKKYFKDRITQDETDIILNKYKFKMHAYYPIFIFLLLMGRGARILIIYFVRYFYI